MVKLRYGAGVMRFLFEENGKLICRDSNGDLLGTLNHNNTGPEGEILASWYRFQDLRIITFHAASSSFRLLRIEFKRSVGLKLISEVEVDLPFGLDQSVFQKAAAFEPDSGRPLLIAFDQGGWYFNTDADKHPVWTAQNVDNNHFWDPSALSGSPPSVLRTHFLGNMPEDYVHVVLAGLRHDFVLEWVVSSDNQVQKLRPGNENRYKNTVLYRKSPNTELVHSSKSKSTYAVVVRDGKNLSQKSNLNVSTTNDPLLKSWHSQKVVASNVRDMHQFRTFFMIILIWLGAPMGVAYLSEFFLSEAGLQNTLLFDLIEVVWTVYVLSVGMLGFILLTGVLGEGYRLLPKFMIRIDTRLRYYPWMYGLRLSLEPQYSIEIPGVQSLSQISPGARTDGPRLLIIGRNEIRTLDLKDGLHTSAESFNTHQVTTGNNSLIVPYLTDERSDEFHDRLFLLGEGRERGQWRGEGLSETTGEDTGFGPTGETVQLLEDNFTAWPPICVYPDPPTNADQFATGLTHSIQNLSAKAVQHHIERLGFIVNQEFTDLLEMLGKKFEPHPQAAKFHAAYGWEHKPAKIFDAVEHSILLPPPLEDSVGSDVSNGWEQIQWKERIQRKVYPQIQLPRPISLDVVAPKWDEPSLKKFRLTDWFQYPQIGMKHKPTLEGLINEGHPHLKAIIKNNSIVNSSSEGIRMGLSEARLPDGSELYRSVLNQISSIIADSYSFAAEGEDTTTTFDRFFEAVFGKEKFCQQSGIAKGLLDNILNIMPDVRTFGTQGDDLRVDDWEGKLNALSLSQMYPIPMARVDENAVTRTDWVDSKGILVTESDHKLTFQPTPRIILHLPWTFLLEDVLASRIPFLDIANIITELITETVHYGDTDLIHEIEAWSDLFFSSDGIQWSTVDVDGHRRPRKEFKAHFADVRHLLWDTTQDEQQTKFALTFLTVAILITRQEDKQNIPGLKDYLVEQFQNNLEFQDSDWARLNERVRIKADANTAHLSIKTKSAEHKDAEVDFHKELLSLSNYVWEFKSNRVQKYWKPDHSLDNQSHLLALTNIKKVFLTDDASKELIFEINRSQAIFSPFTENGSWLSNLSDEGKKLLSRLQGKTSEHYVVPNLETVMFLEHLSAIEKGSGEKKFRPWRCFERKYASHFVTMGSKLWCDENNGRALGSQSFRFMEDLPGLGYLIAKEPEDSPKHNKKAWDNLRTKSDPDHVRLREIVHELHTTLYKNPRQTSSHLAMHGDLHLSNILVVEKNAGSEESNLQLLLCDFSDTVLEVHKEGHQPEQIHRREPHPDHGEERVASSFWDNDPQPPRINALSDLGRFIANLIFKIPIEAKKRGERQDTEMEKLRREWRKSHGLSDIHELREDLEKAIDWSNDFLADEAFLIRIGEKHFKEHLRAMVFEHTIRLSTYWLEAVDSDLDVFPWENLRTLMDVFYPEEKESSISISDGRRGGKFGVGPIPTVRIRKEITEFLRARPANIAEILEHLNKTTKQGEKTAQEERLAIQADTDAHGTLHLTVHDPAEDRRDQASSPPDGAVGLLTSIGTNPLNVLDTLEFARVKGCTHVGYVLSDRAKPEKERYAKMMSDFAHHRSPGMVIEDLTEAFEDVDEPWKLPAPMLTTLAQGLSLDDPHGGGRMLAVDASGSPGFTAWCMAAKGLEAVEFHEHQGTTFSVDDQAQADDPVVGNQEWKSLLVVEHFLDGKQRFDFHDVPFHATLELNETSSVDTHRNLWFNLHRNGEEEFGSSSEDGKKKHLLLSSTETSELLALMNQIQHIGGRFSFARTWMRFNAEGLLGGHSVLSIGGKFILKLQNIAQRSGLIRFPDIRPDFESDGEWAPMQALLYKKGSERVNVRYHAQRRPATEFKSALRIADDLLCSTCSLLVLTRHPEKTIKRIQTIDPTLRPSRVSSFIGEHDLAPEHLFGRDLRDVLNHLPLESTSISQRNAERGQEWLHAAGRLMVHEEPEKKTIRSKATYTNESKTHIDLSSRESDLVSALVGTKEFGSVLFLSESELVEELGEPAEDGQEGLLQYTSKKLNLMPTLRNPTSPDSIALSLQADGDLRAHLFDHTFSNDLLAVFHKILRYNSLDFATPVPVLLVNRNLLAAWKNNRRLTVLEDLNFLEQALGPAFDYRFIVCDQGPISVQDLVNLHLNHGGHGKRWVVDPDGLHLVGQGRCEDPECERAMCQFGINCEWAEGDCRFCHCSLTYSDVEEE